MSLMHEGASEDINRPQLGDEFTKALELGGGQNLTERVRLVRKHLPQMGWDQDILELGQQIEKSGLVTPGLKLCQGGS